MSTPRHFPRTLCLFAFLSACGAAVAAPEFSLSREEVRSRYEIEGRTAVADFDGDGRDDVALLTSPGPTLTVLGEDANGDIVIKQSLRFLPALVSLPRFGLGHRLESPGEHDLFVSMGPELVEFSGWPLQERRRLSGLGAEYGVWAVDVDADGDVELVRLSDKGLAAHDYATGAFEWSSSLYGSELTVLQLDADPALELVLSGSPGRVLDGATRLADFTHEAGFGHIEPLPDGHGFASARSLVADVFRTAPLRLERSIEQGYSRAAAADVDGDGQHELVMSAPDRERALVHDLATGAVRHSLSIRGFQPSRVIAADLDGDGDDEVVLHAQFSDGDLLHLAALAPELPRAILPRMFAVHAPVARGDTDGDGDEEWLLATHNGYPAQLRDAATGEVQWQWPVPGSTEPRDRFAHVRAKLENLDDDPALEIILLGEDDYGARAMVFDAVTHELQLDWRGTAEYDHIATHRVVHDLQKVDADGDGGHEWLLALSGKGNIGAKLLLITPAGETRWESVGMGTTQNDILRLMLVQTDADSALEWVVAMRNSLRAYDGITRDLDWTQAIIAQHVTLYPGVLGDEFLLLDRGNISYLNVHTRGLLRSHPGVPDATAVALLPDSEGRFVVANASYLYAFDGRAGRRVARSPYAGQAVALGSGQLAVRSEGEQTWSVLLGDVVGWREYRLDGNQDVFLDGFER